MEKNIAALLREDARTVHVSFDMTVADFDNLDVDINGVPMKPAGAPRNYRPDAKNSGLNSYTYVRDLPLQPGDTYVSHLPLQPGDTVVVQAAGEIKLALVMRVDDEADIEPNSSVRYSWVIAKVDMAAHQANEKRNRELERTVADAYRTNMRRSFTQAVLGAVDPDKRLAIENLLRGPAQ